MNAKSHTAKRDTVSYHKSAFRSNIFIVCILLKWKKADIHSDSVAFDPPIVSNAS